MKVAFEFKQCKTKESATKTAKVIEGLYEIQPKVFGDARGYFFESYSLRDFKKAGVIGEDEDFVQSNQSKSTKAVLRGLHFQTKHPQGKLVRVVKGKVYDVAVDLRCGSPTFGEYYGVVLSEEKNNMFYIPKCFAHGFFVLSDEAIFTYDCTDFYDSTGESGIMWNDETLNIDWDAVATRDMKPLLSPKDEKHPAFDPSGSYFDMQGKWQGK